MDDRLYKFLKYTALILVLAFIGWSFYDGLIAERRPGDQSYQAGNRFFEDGDYRQALGEYDAALQEHPDAAYIIRAKARSLMQLGRNEEALQWFEKAINLEPYFGGVYANRGILHDRMGNYEAAVADYEKSLQLDESVAEGPHWLTRFLRNQPDAPPTVKDRLIYLKAELAKPPEQRKLRDPDVDARQRSYKQGS